MSSYLHKNRNIYPDIAKDFKTRVDTSNYELERSLPKGKTYEINARKITWGNDDNVCCIESKCIQLFNRWW